MYVNSPEELLSFKEMVQMSGLDFMERMRDGRLPAPPIGRTMGFTLSLVEEGKVIFTGAPSFNVTNPMGTVHGGWYGTLLDSAMACAVMTKTPEGHAYTTLEYKINIVRAIPLGFEIDCIGEVSHFGRTTSVANGEIRGKADGRLYATGSTTCLIMKFD